MYCIRCGVKLADTEKKCPLCETVVYHPEIVREEAEPLFPPERYPEPYSGSRVPQIVVTVFWLMAASVALLCDLQINGKIVWSGYVIGALLIAYASLVLPYWFRKPNPVFFVPVVFVVTGLYLHYINHATNGDWFISLALPTTGGFGLIITAATVLLRYIHRGKLYIFGGVIIAMGLFVLLLEYLICITFQNVSFIGWSLYPLLILLLLGGMLIALGIVRPAKEIVRRKTFI